MIGIALFTVASAIGGLAQNEAMLLGSRGFQGVGAALASPTALALITTTFPAGPQRNRAFSVFAAMAGLGAAIGLVLGGWLTGIDPNLGWRLTFLINVPIGLAAVSSPRACSRTPTTTPAPSTSPAPSSAPVVCSRSSSASPAPATRTRSARPTAGATLSR